MPDHRRSKRVRLAPTALAMTATLAPMHAFAQTLASAEVQSVVVQAAPHPGQDRLDLSTSVTHSVQDTPQVMNVVPQEMIQQQKIVTLEQALRDSPGITVAIGEGGTLAGDQFKIRGQDASNDIYSDGLRDFGVYVRDTFDTQEVQVLKGPAGSMFGRGTTGGAINTVSKAPLAGKSFLSVDGQVGNGDDYRATLDLNHPFNATTAARLNIMGTRAGVVDRDTVKSDRWGVAGAVGFGLGTNKTLTLNALHQEDDRIPDYGIVIGAPTGVIKALPASEYGVPRNTFEQFTNDRDRTRADIFTARAAWNVSPRLTLESDTRFGNYGRSFRYTSVDSCLVNAATHQTCIDALVDNNPATLPLITFGGGGPYKQRAWGVQNITSAHGTFDLGGFKNEFVAGIDINYQDNRKIFYAYTLPPLSSGIYAPGTTVAARNAITINLLTGAGAPLASYHPFRPVVTPNVAVTGIPGTSITSNAYIINSAGTAADYAGFVTDRLYFTPQISLIAGVRYEDYEAQFKNLLVSGVTTAFSADSHLTSPRGALVYEPSKDADLYVSYARSATPVGTAIVGSATPIAATTQAFAPDEGESYEVGAKLAVLGGRLALDAALFHINKANAKQTDPTSGMIDAQSSQKQTIQGGEFGAVGKITPDWGVNIAYTYLDTKVRQDLACTTATATVASVCTPNPVTTGTAVLQVPANSAFIWTSYRLDAYVRGVTVAGGVTYQDGFHLRYTTTGTGPSTVLTRDAFVPYTLSLDGVVQYERHGWRAGLNVYNLTDRLNYAQSFGNRAAPAQGRTFVVSIGRTF